MLFSKGSINNKLKAKIGLLKEFQKIKLLTSNKNKSNYSQ